jgi:glycosyltransferase involved in cell wall biosynthesis
MVARGARPEDVRVFANTVDIAAWSKRADTLRQRRSELRAGRGFREDDVVVLSVGRLVAEKGIDTLLRAVAKTGDARLRVVLAGDGPEANRLRALAAELGVQLTLAGNLPQEALAEQYVCADAFALLSLHETWGVVVNEAAASGLPLLLSDRVGAARDLVLPGENGFVVPAADVDAAAAALTERAADADRRSALGRRSRDLVGAWGYDESVENFVEAVREATAR